VKDRLFTVSEVNALIPRLEIIMGKLQRHGLVLREQLNELAHAMGQAADEITTADLLELRPELRPVVGAVDELLRQVESHGGTLKGIDLGLVDFLGEVDGEVVLLCWQYGEKEVGFYHSLDGGFAGRKPIGPKSGRPTYLQ
jgi:hypothetical protein